MNLRTAMVEKNITRLVKTGSGEGRFETIEDLAVTEVDAVENTDRQPSMLEFEVVQGGKTGHG